MNDVTISAVLKGGFTQVSNDGVRFTLVSSNPRTGMDEFIVLAYGKSALFLQQHANSGDRVVIQGRLSSEKLDTDVYHTAVTANRVLSIGSGESGIDYSRAFVSGLATCDGIKTVGSGKSLANFNIANERKYMSREGEERSYTTYLSATMWGDRALDLEQQGLIPAADQEVMIEGLLKPRTYVNGNGEEVSKIDIWIDDLVFSQAHSSPEPRRKPNQNNNQQEAPFEATESSPTKAKSMDSSPF